MPGFLEETNVDIILDAGPALIQHWVNVSCLLRFLMQCICVDASSDARHRLYHVNLTTNTFICYGFCV